MTSSPRVVRVGLSLLVRLAHEVAETRLGYSPQILGESLAAQVQAYVRQEGLGYYPPLEYLGGQPAIEQGLVALIQEVAQFSCSVLSSEFRRRLRGMFPSHQVVNMYCTAHTMPRVRRGQLNALVELSRHYAPDRVRAELIVSYWEKDETEAPEQLAADKALRCLKGGFAAVELLGVRTL